MAIRLESSLSKRVPLPGVDYSSYQASITVSGEIVDLAQLPQEAARLFAACEQAVDQQLIRLQSNPSLVSATTTQQAQPVAPTPPGPGSAPSRPAPYPSSHRRAPSQVSAAQLRFLRQLCDRTPGAQERILEEHHVASLDLLTSRAASGVIDRLKGG